MAGEQSGNLPGTIGRYLDYARVIAQTKTRIRTALVYPTLLLSFSLILMGILVNFILPQFARFYLDFEAELPAVSQFLIKLTTILRKMTPFLLGFGIAVIFTLSQLKKREKNRILLDKLKLRIPYARRIWTDTGISLFSRTLGLLLEAGITLLPSLPIASQAIPNKFLPPSGRRPRRRNPFRFTGQGGVFPHAGH
jgi:type IV pilus assembly protein PilC